MVIKRLAILSLLLLLVNTLYAQRKNWAIRTMDWGYKLVQGDSAHPRKRYFFVVPIFSYKPETRWQIGLSFSHFFRAKNLHDSTTRPSVVRLNTSYTQNNQFSVRPMFEVFTAGNRYSIRGQLQFTRFAENYWGIGNRTTDANKENYSFSQYKANLKATRLLGKKIYAGLLLNFEEVYNLGYKAASSMPQSGVEGITGYHSLGLGPVITYDSRNHVYFPTRGSFIDLGAAWYNRAAGSSSSFHNLTVDARTYWGLWNDNVMAFQGYATLNSSGVPYRLMGSLGSDTYMRGYYSGRYRDLHAVSLQAEFRKQVWGPVGLVVFGGAGNVSSSLSGLNQFVKPMYGAGLRVKAIPREKVNMRIDYAMGSSGSTAFYITINEAF